MHTFGGLDDAGRVCGPDKGLWVAVCFGDEALYGRLEGRASIRRSFCAGWLECARTGLATGTRRVQGLFRRKRAAGTAS